MELKRRSSKSAGVPDCRESTRNLSITSPALFRKVVLLLTGLDVHTNFLRRIRDGGKWGEGGTYVMPSTRCTVTTRKTLHQDGQLFETFECLVNCVGSHTTVHKPQVLKSRSGSNRGPAYQPSAFPLGHTDSPGCPGCPVPL